MPKTRILMKQMLRESLLAYLLQRLNSNACRSNATLIGSVLYKEHNLFHFKMQNKALQYDIVMFFHTVFSYSFQCLQM